MGAYHRAKRIVVFSIAGFFLLAIAKTELVWASSFVETQGTVVALEQTCAEGSTGRTRWVDCSEALPGATRRTVIDLQYVSPADGQKHQAAVRCDTAGDDTPSWFVGEQLTVLAHKSEPERMDRRRCKSLGAAERDA